jgi:hypothetical protein
VSLSRAAPLLVIYIGAAAATAVTLFVRADITR